MSLKKNTIANYIGQGYTTLIGIFMLPFYLTYLGGEAYGLVGFFTVMAAWLALLDMGLSPTLARQCAHQRGLVGNDLGKLRQLVRSIEVVFAVLSLGIGIGINLAAPWIASQWLTVKTLPQTDVSYCITLMGIIIGLRWFGSLYRGGIQGMEQMVWLNAANIVIASLRYVLVYGMLRWVTQQATHFFEFQLAVSLIELAVLGIKFYVLMPKAKLQFYGFSWPTLKAVLPFTGSIAYTSSLWILLTQTDKLILSHLLPLKEYGYFALVAVIANGLLTLTNPVSQAILPRMTLLLSQGNEADMLGLYRKSTQLVATLIFPIAGTLALFAKQVLFAWTGDLGAANWGGPILQWLMLGNGILAISSFQYYLQYAYGKLRLQVINSTINTIAQLPILIFAANHYGALGVAYAWFALRLATFFIFPSIVHNRLAPGLHFRWLFIDLLPRLLLTVLCLTFFSIVIDVVNLQGRIALAAFLSLVVGFTITANIGLFFIMQQWQKRKC
ncbi:MAG: polysaccharide biosynthesis protein [Methylococcaceae bacterium]|nr:polysaccharide biosynthesis protein [Methylococcaceae bacterium]